DRIARLLAGGLEAHRLPHDLIRALEFREGLRVDLQLEAIAPPVDRGDPRAARQRPAVERAHDVRIRKVAEDREHGGIARPLLQAVGPARHEPVTILLSEAPERRPALPGLLDGDEPLERLGHVRATLEGLGDRPQRGYELAVARQVEPRNAAVSSFTTRTAASHSRRSTVVRFTCGFVVLQRWANRYG